MNSIQSLVHRLISEAAEYDIAISDAQAAQLLNHLSLVIEKNKQLNLTRIISPLDGMRLHILDSLLFLPYLEDDARFLDLGTGAGFPGIPILICSNTTSVLLDSVQKKIRAVTEFISELALSHRCEVSSDRVEEYARSHRSSFDAVTARAVAPLDVLVEYASPLLRRNGIMVCSKGRLGDDELSNGLRSAQFCGMKLVTHDMFELPDDAGHRELLVFKKCGTPKVRLPRRVGEAKKSPLSQQ